MIADLNRYTLSKIVLTDPALEPIRVTAVFRTDDVDSLLEALELTLDVKVTKITPLLILISPAGDA